MKHWVIDGADQSVLTISDAPKRAVRMPSARHLAPSSEQSGPRTGLWAPELSLRISAGQ